MRAKLVTVRAEDKPKFGAAGKRAHLGTVAKSGTAAPAVVSPAGVLARSSTGGGACRTGGVGAGPTTKQQCQAASRESGVVLPMIARTQRSALHLTADAARGSNGWSRCPP